MFVVNYILLFDLYGHGIFVFIVLSLYVHCMFLIQLLAAIQNKLLIIISFPRYVQIFVENHRDFFYIERIFNDVLEDDCVTDNVVCGCRQVLSPVSTTRVDGHS